MSGLLGGVTNTLGETVGGVTKTAGDTGPPPLPTFFPPLFPTFHHKRSQLTYLFSPTQLAASEILSETPPKA